MALVSHRAHFPDAISGNMRSGAGPVMKIQVFQVFSENRLPNLVVAQPAADNKKVEMLAAGLAFDELL